MLSCAGGWPGGRRLASEAMSVAIVSEKQMRDDVPVEPFRERFLELERRGELTAVDVAIRLGWSENRQPRRRPDSQRVRRVLGLAARQDHNHVLRIQTFVTVTTAEKLAEALDLDFWEVGL